MIINNQFSFNLKPEWRDTTVFTFAGPVEDGIRHDIIITVENPVEIADLDHYSDAKVRELESSLQGYTQLKRGDLFLKDGTPAHEIVFKWYPVENRRIYQRMVYVMGNNIAYNITTSFSKKTWKMLGHVVGEMVNSFELQVPLKQDLNATIVKPRGKAKKQVAGNATVIQDRKAIEAQIMQRKKSKEVST